MPEADRRLAALTPIDPEALGAGRRAVPDDDIIEGIVAAFRAVGDPTRARILYALTPGPMCVRDLAILVGVSESAISHQLRFLRERHLVEPNRRGNVIAYALADHHIGALFREAEYHADHIRSGMADHPYP